MKSTSYPGSRGASYYIRIVLAVVAIGALIYFCSSQSSSSTSNGNAGTEATTTPRPIPTQTLRPTQTVIAPDALTATASALSAHEGTVRMMSYKILFGGEGERLSLVTTILKAYNPDIFAIQETNGWNADDFAIANQVADELGMEYVYCSGESSLKDDQGRTYDMVFMTRYQILSSEVYSNVSNCLVRAEVLLPNEQKLQVFASYIRPDFEEAGCQNIANTAEVIKEYAGETAVLIGSLNVPPPAIQMGYPPIQLECPPLLVEAGFEFVTDANKLDHLWGTQSLLEYESVKLPSPINSPLVSKKTINDASDRWPVVLDFVFP